MSLSQLRSSGSHPEGVYDNIRAWDLGDEKLDVIALTEEAARRFGKDGPISTLARCLIALDEAEVEADQLREGGNSDAWERDRYREALEQIAAHELEDDPFPAAPRCGPECVSALQQIASSALEGNR